MSTQLKFNALPAECLNSEALGIQTRALRVQKSLLKHGMADKGMRQKIRKRNAESDIEHNMKEQDTNIVEHDRTTQKCSRANMS